MTWGNAVNTRSELLALCADAGLRIIKNSVLPLQYSRCGEGIAGDRLVMPADPGKGRRVRHGLRGVLHGLDVTDAGDVSVIDAACPTRSVHTCDT